ncbi:LLM class F420-dependent oxidoreductase [Streptomyces yokosukanensis]|uniref:LLM class F420-dependent oxidoreductase n=1 Tax=Streptomyces yokosukanensis TaxID=67386 RepID=A0A101NNS7_9ACTN|nr:TIGR03620 family F420-dependent LLM class oxidoreductase [Streptomyces yokosukanensis]KUM96387.1 LLM class F420-dependent oxidoreductase [Streptomyces yokosukanensis]
MELGALGIWSLAFTHGDPGEAADAAAEAEELGYGTVWLGGDPGGNPRGDLVSAARVLRATRHVTVATACVSIWGQSAECLAGAYHALPASERGRLVVGLGVSHGEIVDTYRRPYSAMAGYLDGLDSAPAALPARARLVGAHGPRMSRLAADRTLGIHPYLVDSEHVARTRELLGPGPLLALEQTVILRPDPAAARAQARETLATYLPLANYRSAWLRSGFTEDDLGDGGSDRLVDSLFLWGGPEVVAAGLAERRAAGADHIAVQIATASRTTFTRDDWRELAAALIV